MIKKQGSNFYIIGNEALRRTMEYAKTLGWQFVFIGKEISGYKGIHVKAGPREFLYVIANANYVITNSFHGFAFALIFEKQILVCEHTTRNLRLVNLLEQIGMQDKQVNSLTKDIAPCRIDGKKAYLKLDIQCGRSYLDKIFCAKGKK